MSVGLKCALITPARNEERLIEGTIRAVVAQTTPPVKWIIVSDGSTDRTDDIVKQYAAQYPWIELLRLPERADRQFAAKAHAFNAAWEKIRRIDCDVVGNLDADVTFEPDFLEFLLGKFAADPKLGVAGTAYVEPGFNQGRTSDHQFANAEHVPGPCQLFRRACLEELGGYTPVKGGAIDWIAVTTARMRGWRTRSFPERTYTHHRTMGTAESHPLRAKFHYGRKAYYVGGHPVWELLRGFYQMRNSPRIVGGLCFQAGYVWACLTRIERPVSPELMAFHRREQMSRLSGVARRLTGAPKPQRA
jgi:glycosyltransferase involved in cell wall biosynthesis